ncbi:ATP synthase protein I [Arthrobacter sp. CAN_A2]|uniref:hypothetical protein n=1 Tax=Arthrobacter sp. CAN_A2 TaxID=2787718 RepID=UPI0018F01646
MPRPENPATGADDPTLSPASGPTTSPWLRILARSAAAGTATAVVLAAVALLVSSPAAGLSVLFGAALVMTFFGISLLIGHFTGRTNPSGALGLFAVTYAIKVVGFGAVLFLFGTPGWLERTWFFWGALATVIVWQVAEVVAFSRLRTPLYNDTPGPTGSIPAFRPPEGH